MLAELTVRQEPRDGRLIEVPPAGLDLTRSLHAIRRSGTRIRGSLGDFLTLAAHHPHARNRRRRRRGHRTGPGRDLRHRALRYGHRRTYRGDLLQLRGSDRPLAHLRPRHRRDIPGRSHYPYVAGRLAAPTRSVTPSRARCRYEAVGPLATEAR
ncbi:hypothetical protein [Rhodococcus opacus]|uniref:hypothetical protein n=1 Tax=Rhodococcus opacus TaxID=37919 RepID=UPI001F1937FF|nr:hypothetical protein [Rhodococcus opacus]